MATEATAFEAWKIAMESTNSFLPVPKSRFSSRDKLTIRHVYSILNNPPPEWVGQTVFLAHMYKDELATRLVKIAEEERKNQSHWTRPRILPPAEVGIGEWQTRCASADNRENETTLQKQEGATEETIWGRKANEKCKKNLCKAKLRHLVQWSPEEQEDRGEFDEKLKSIRRAKVEALKEASRLRELRMKKTGGPATHHTSGLHWPPRELTQGH